MKSRFLLTILLTLMTALPLAAQDGLHINAYFGGHFKAQKDATEVLLKGSKLRPYHLTLFRSISLPSSTSEAHAIEQAVRKDVAGATDKEAGLRGGRLYYGFYRLRSIRKGENRYIFYRNDALAGGSRLTLIYMEGAATIEELRQHFGR